MADIKNCKNCGKPFFTNDYGEFLCRNCEEAEHKLLKELRDYIFNNPGTSAYDLSRIFKIRVDRITRYIQDDNKLRPL